MISRPIKIDSSDGASNNGLPMTLVVSVRVPDGVVVGADSLATLAVAAQGKVVGKSICPHCNTEHDVEVDINLPPGMGTLSTMPYSLKLVPMVRHTAVATYGLSMIGDRTVFSLLSEYQRRGGEQTTREVAQGLGEMVHEHLGTTTDLATIPEGASVLGFHASGYENERGTTFVVNVGRTVNIEEYGELGATVSGEGQVLTQLWQLSQVHPQMGSAHQAWSVLDAADYVRFAISTTASFQRFATMIPNVGGDIDIALVTPQGKFSWIQKKPLVDLLLREGGDD